MITNEVYVEIEVLRKHGFSLRKIAAQVGCAVNTVRRHLAVGQTPKYVRRKQRETKLTPFETYLRERQKAAYPHWIPATVLQREIAAQGLPRRDEPVACLLARAKAVTGGGSRGTFRDDTGRANAGGLG